MYGAAAIIRAPLCPGRDSMLFHQAPGFAICPHGLHSIEDMGILLLLLVILLALTGSLFFVLKVALGVAVGVVLGVMLLLVVGGALIAWRIRKAMRGPGSQWRRVGHSRIKVFDPKDR